MKFCTSLLKVGACEKSNIFSPWDDVERGILKDEYSLVLLFGIKSWDRTLSSKEVGFFFALLLFILLFCCFFAVASNVVRSLLKLKSNMLSTCNLIASCFCKCLPKWAPLFVSYLLRRLWLKVGLYNFKKYEWN